MDQQKQLILAMERANQRAADARRKKELKLWSEISSPYTLKEALERLTKNELDEIRQNLRLKKLSGLKKAELNQELYQQVPKKFQEFLLLMDSERLHYVLEIVRNEGVIEVDLSLERAEYFRGYGFFFSGAIQGKRVLTMPNDLIEFFKTLNITQLKKQAQRNSELIQLTHGLLFYYGILELQELLGFIEKYTHEPVDDYNFIQLLFNSMRYYNRIKPTYHIGFCDARVDETERILNDRKLYPFLDYFHLSKKQILEAGNPFFVDVTPELEALINLFVAHYDFSKEELGQMALDCVDFVQYGLKPEEILRFLRNEMQLPINSMELEQELMFHLINLYDSTRLWTLKGYTYNELVQLDEKLSTTKFIPKEQKNEAQLPSRGVIIDFKTRKPIGPDDFCPCGSGFYFSKCCGK